MNQLTLKLLSILLLFVSSLPVVYSQTLQHPKKVSQHSTQQHRRGESLIEEFSFWIKDLKVAHQGQSVLNIFVSYRYATNIKNADYPDFRLLTKDVERFLNSYPNEDDYWEIVNKQLTAMLLAKYPALSSITIELKLEPSDPLPYVRSSRVTRERPAVSLNRKRS